jgi:serine/threonine protein kinase
VFLDRRLLRHAGRLAPGRVVEIARQLCAGLHAAHTEGVLHRDLKPANILVTLYDGKPVPKIIDFGVAKATGGKLTNESLSTQFGAVIGTFDKKVWQKGLGGGLTYASSVVQW